MILHPGSPLEKNQPTQLKENTIYRLFHIIITALFHGYSYILHVLNIKHFTQLGASYPVFLLFELNIINYLFHHVVNVFMFTSSLCL